SAAAQFDRAAADPSQKPTALYWKALSQKALGGLEQAAESLAAAADAAGDRAPIESIRYQQADVQRKLGQAEAARQTFLEIVERWPKSDLADDALYAAAELALESAQDDTAANRFQTAEGLLERFSREYPQSGLRMYVQLLSGRLQ